MEFTLDYNTWRCGGDGDNALGDGDTSLLNIDGFMCCLGQFSLQVDKELTEADIRNEAEPYHVREIQYFSYGSSEEGYASTNLASDAVYINDDCNTTPQEKIIKLQETFAKEGHTITVINQPK